jgi:hypothetical protein
MATVAQSVRPSVASPLNANMCSMSSGTTARGHGPRGYGGYLLSVLALGLGAFLFIEVLPSHVASPANSSWLDEIFASRIVLALVRVGLAAGAVYVFVSIVALISEGRWLSELGPAKASKAKEPIDAIDSGVGGYGGGRQNEQGRNVDLKHDLAQSDDKLSEARAVIAVLIDHIATLESTGGTRDGF